MKDDGRRLPHQDHQRCNNGTTLTKKSRAIQRFNVNDYSLLLLSLSFLLPPPFLSLFLCFCFAASDCGALKELSCNPKPRNFFI